MPDAPVVEHASSLNVAEPPAVGAKTAIPAIKPPIAIPSAVWKSFCVAHGAWPAYADLAGFDLFAPCGFVDGANGIAYIGQDTVDAYLRGESWAAIAIYHEWRHLKGLPAHPATVEACMAEAASYGFDERSFSRAVRTHVADQAAYSEAEAWFTAAFGSPPPLAVTKTMADQTGILAWLKLAYHRAFWPTAFAFAAAAYAAFVQGGRVLTGHSLLLDALAGAGAAIAVLKNDRAGPSEPLFGA